MAVKLDWKKNEKTLYGGGAKPRRLEVGPLRFLALCGQGNPNRPEFSEQVGALFPLAYALKMHCKRQAAQDPAGGLAEYAVYPLEGVWTLADPAAGMDKGNFAYQIMIHQPDFITQAMVAEALEEVKRKKPNPWYGEVTFVTLEEGPCVQLLHVGPFDDEPASFAKMDAFCAEEGLRRRGQEHREIYLNNLNRTAPEKLKTMLRYPVEPVE